MPWSLCLLQCTLGNLLAPALHWSPAQGLAGHRPCLQAVQLLPVQGLAGYRPLLLHFRHGPRAFAAVSLAPAAPARFLPWLQAAFALPVDACSWSPALNLRILASAQAGHLSSQLRLCTCFVLLLRHWPCRPCLLVTSSWLRPFAEDSFLVLPSF